MNDAVRYVSAVDPPQWVTNQQLEEFHRQVVNELMSRSDYMRGLDERRDYDKECGYPKNVTPEQFQNLFDCDPIANRIVTLLPDECFKMPPKVYETEDLGTADEKVATEFERSWKQHVKDVAAGSSSGVSWHSDESASVIVKKWRQLDVESGIGRYGVMFIGFDDGQSDLGKPVVPRQGMKVLHLRVFPESLAQITKKESSLSSPRYGQPVEYELSFSEPDAEGAADANVSDTVKVHWTRVIHCPSDEDACSDVYGKERLRVHVKRLVDLVKLYGGSAEMYWRGAFMGISIETNPNLGSNVQLPVEAMRNMVNDYQNGLQRYLALAGASAKTLSPQVVDPGKQIDVQLTAICIQMSCPKRVFMGSERGELGSSHDRAEWNDVIRGRQRNRCGPRIIVQYVDRLIWAGSLAKPAQENGWRHSWPDLDSLSAKDVAEIGGILTEALQGYVESGADTAVPLKNWLISFMGFDQEEAQKMVDAAREATTSDSLDGVIGGKLFGTVGGVYGMTELWDKFQVGAYSEETMAMLIQLFFKVSPEIAKKIIATGVEIVQPGPDVTGQSKLGPNGQPVKQSVDVGTQKPRRGGLTGRSPQLKGNK